MGIYPIIYWDTIYRNLMSINASILMNYKECKVIYEDNNILEGQRYLIIWRYAILPRESCYSQKKNIFIRSN